MLTLDDGEPPVTIHSPCPPNVIPILDRHSAVIEWHSTWDPDSALHRQGRGPGQGPGMIEAYKTLRSIGLPRC